MPFARGTPSEASTYPPRRPRKSAPIWAEGAVATADTGTRACVEGVAAVELSPLARATDLYFPTICSGDGLFSQMNSRRSVSGSSV